MSCPLAAFSSLQLSKGTVASYSLFGVWEIEEPKEVDFSPFTVQNDLSVEQHRV